MSGMPNFRELVIFLAGMEAFHTLSHIWLPFAVDVPMKLKFPRMTFTARWNIAAIVVNAVVTVLLMEWVGHL